MLNRLLLLLLLLIPSIAHAQRISSLPTRTAAQFTDPTTAYFYVVDFQDLSTGYRISLPELKTLAGVPTVSNFASQLLDDTSASVMRTTLGLGSAATTSSGDYATAVHSHAISDVTNLQTTLDGKAALSHSHSASDITSGTFASARFADNTIAHTRLSNTASNGRLLGSPSSSGVVGEITVGSGLTLSGSTLSLSGGGGGGTPGGSSGQLQYNNAGAFAGATDVLYSSGQLSVTPAWSGTGTATTPLLVNVTADPGPANAASKLLDLQIAGSTRIAGNKAGSMLIAGSYFDLTGIYGFQPLTSGSTYIDSGSTLIVRNAAGGFVELMRATNDTLSIGQSANCVLARDAADILALRRSTNANQFRVYETASGSPGTDFSRGVFGFKDSSGVSTTTLRIGTEAGGSGTARAVSIVTGGTERLNITANSVATFTFDTTVVSNGLFVKGTDATTYCTIGSSGISTTNQMAELSSVGGVTGRLNIGAGQMHLTHEAGNLSVLKTYGNLSLRPGGLGGGGGTTVLVGASGDIGYTRAAASILGITNGSTGPGVLAIDNVQGTNFERLKSEWASNVARVGTSKGGSGTSRPFAIITDDTERVRVAADAGSVTITGGTVTASSKPIIDATQTWNDAAVNFVGFKQNITLTAANTNSLLFDWQVGGVSYLKLTQYGDLVGSSFTGTDFSVRLQNGGLKLGSASVVNWGSSNATGTMDGGFYRAGVGLIGVTNGSTGYGTLVSDRVQGANFERLKFGWDESQVARIGTEKGGSGTARDLALITNDSTRVTVGGTSGVTTFNSDQIRIATDKTPANATDTGVAGTICIDDNYIYICTATNTWKRAAIATW